MPTSFYAKNSNRLPSLSCYLKYYMHAQLLQHHTGETVLPYETAVLVFCLFVFWLHVWIYSRDIYKSLTDAEKADKLKQSLPPGLTVKDL